LKLSGVNGRYGFLCFHLDEDTALDDDIRAESAVDPHSLVDQWYGPLALDLELILSQLVLETREIRTLEQAWAESPVNSNGGVEHARRQSIQRFCGSGRRGHAHDVAAGMPKQIAAVSGAFRSQGT